MWHEPFDGWKQQGRYLAEAQASLARRQPKPTQPIHHFEITFMYFMDSSWRHSREARSAINAPAPMPTPVTRRQKLEQASRLKR